MEESKTYGKMLEEVDAIVKGLSSGDIDLDHMVGEVERGYALIKAMRQRLQLTRSRVEDLRKDLEFKNE